MNTLYFFILGTCLAVVPARSDDLKPEYQKILLDEGKAAALISRKMVDDEEAGQLKELEKLIKVNKIASQQPFATAVAPVYEAAKKKYGAAIIEKIQAIK